MLKLSNYALAIALLQRATSASAECSGNIATLAPGAECNFDNFKTALSADCNITELFREYTGNIIQYNDPATEIAAICEYDAPTQFVEIQGTYRADQRYFAGGGQLVDGDNWAIDTGRIKRFETNMGNKTLIAFPEYAARLKYNNDPDRGADKSDNGYPANMNLETSCELNTIMCCFTDDSMESSFSDNGDATTDVCRHDLHDSPESNHIKEGWSVFPGDETNTHCVGFTWNDDEEELLGNIMYDVSLRNTAKYGYREGVPGSPMCGCVEHMPVVASASCRTAAKKSGSDIVYSFDFDVDSNEGLGDVSASNAVDIEYNDCVNEDLATQYKANNAGDDDAAALIDAHLVGTGKCADDLEVYLNDEQFLHEGQHPTKYIVPDDKWSDLVVGEGIYFQPPNIDPIQADTDFRALIEADCEEIVNGITVKRNCIIRRICPSCRAESHRDIYYKRKTALPKMGTNSTNGEVYFLNMLMNNWSKFQNDMEAGDFGLYSTYKDALNEVNAWTYCQYDYPDNKVGFPLDCGPFGYVGGEWNSYIRTDGYANHHGFYVELPPPSAR